MQTFHFNVLLLQCSLQQMIKLLAFKTEIMEITNAYIADNCDSKGNQKLNINENLIEGISNLKKRCKEEDLIGMETDKSKRLSITCSQQSLMFKMIW